MNNISHSYLSSPSITEVLKMTGNSGNTTVEDDWDDEQFMDPYAHDYGEHWADQDWDNHDPYLKEFDPDELSEEQKEAIEAQQEESAARFAEYLETLDGRYEMWMRSVNVYMDPYVEDEILAWLRVENHEDMGLLDYVREVFSPLDPEEETATLKILSRAVANRKQAKQNGTDSGRKTLDYLREIMDRYEKNGLPTEWFVELESSVITN